MRPRRRTVTVGRFGPRSVRSPTLRDLRDASEAAGHDPQTFTNQLLSRILTPALSVDDIAALDDGEITPLVRVTRRLMGSAITKRRNETQRETVYRAYAGLLGSMTRAAASIQQSLQPPLSLSSSLTAITAASSTFANPAESGSQSMASVIRTIEAIQRIDFESILRPFREAMRHWASWTRHVQVVYELASKGWIFSPSVVGNDLSDVLDNFDNRGLAAVEEQLMAMFTARRCREVLTACLDHPAFLPWKATLEKAIDAHERGAHELAIPIWLIALQGIWREEVLAEPRPFKVNLKERERDRIYEALSGQGSANVLLIDALTVVCAAMGGDVRPEDTNDVIKRNGVLHGLDPTIGTPTHSVQLVLMLDVLHYCFVHRDEPAPQL